MRLLKRVVLLLFGFYSLITLSFANDCLCDVSQACDILCCCDPECTESDFTRFGCQLTSNNVDTLQTTCVSQKIFSKITPDSSFSFLQVGNDNCFTSTKVSLESTSTKSVSAKLSSIPEQKSNLPPTYTKTFGDVFSDTPSMNFHDLIYIRENSISKPLTLPAEFRNHCVKDSVKFLRNTTASCSLATEGNCQSGSILDSSLYSSWKIVRNFRKKADEIVNITTICVDSSGNQLTCQAPTKTGTNCLNAVTKIALSIEYGIVVNNTIEIVSAEVTLTLQTVSLTTPTTVTTTTRFIGTSQDYPNKSPVIQRYRQGYPIQFQIGGKKDTFSPFSADTECKTHEIRFPGSVIASCVKMITPPVANVNLTSLTQRMFQNLPSHLGKYYNSNESVSNDWLPLDWKLPQIINATSVPMNIILTIARRSYGNELNPENEIVSVVASLASTNLSYLEKEGLIKDKLVFYFTVQFVNIDGRNRREDIITKLSDSISSYFSYQKDSVPLQLFVIAVVVFVVLTLFVLVADQGTPQF